MTRKVIFDTDIGIDDAMALLFLHGASEVDLIGITTVFGNASLADVTRNALYVKHRFAVDAAVHVGAGESLGQSMFEGYPDFVHGDNGLGNIDVPDVESMASSTDAADAIVAAVRQAPGEITLIAVGRLTNIATALERCPELPELASELVIMGGAFGFNGHRGNVSPVAEANIAGDPLAADRVFTSGLKTTIVGLDVTQETILDDSFFDDLRDNAGDAGGFVHDISRHYVNFHESSTGQRACPMHDSSAVAYVLAPELFETRAAGVRVVTDGPALGQTIWSDPEVRYETGDW
ncbi:MAG: nucleoside hydrolase, partial [Pseudomonadota bacterium]